MHVLDSEYDSVLDRFNIDCRASSILWSNNFRVAQLHDVLVSRRNIFLFMELCVNGNLFDLIVEKEQLEEKEARNVFRQLASGVGYFHDQGICHRDLKVRPHAHKM